MISLFSQLLHSFLVLGRPVLNERGATGGTRRRSRKRKRRRKLWPSVHCVVCTYILKKHTLLGGEVKRERRKGGGQSKGLICSYLAALFV